MSKVKVKVTLKTKEDELEEYHLAIKTRDKITYQEKECMTTLIFKENLKMIRKSKDTNIEMLFISDKITNGICEFNNQKLSLDILTDYVIIEENVIIIKYKVLTTEQDVLYKLEVIK